MTILKNNNFINNDKTLTDLIWLDSLILFLMALAPKHIVGHLDRLEYGVENYENIKITINTTSPETIFDKKYLELNKIIYSIENMLLGDHGYIYFADASSNALQLVTLARGTNSRLLLELLNIINNTTKYRNIYFYILDKLKEIDYKNIISINGDINMGENYLITKNYGSLIGIDNSIISSFLSVEIVKSMIMPAAYGKTLHTNFETCNTYLLENNNEIWSTISIELRRKICLLWWTNSFKILKNLGLDLEDHIELCKKNKITKKYIYNHFNIPIITPVYKIVDRLSILNKIKFYKNNLNKLCDMWCIDMKTISSDKFDEIYKKCNIDGVKIINLWKSLNRLKKKIKENDSDTRRIVVYILKKRYQFRVSIIQRRNINVQKLNTAITPNITHAYDAAILMKTLEKLKKYGINSMCIHDSIGTNVELINIVIYLYKETLVESIAFSIRGERYYPYTNDKQYNLANIDYINEIMASDNLFI